MSVLRVSFDYPYPAREVWAVATDFGCFLWAMEGVVAFRGVPREGRIAEGAVYEAEASVFGKLPWQRHVMAVESVDEVAMTFQSRERGDGIARWDHHLRVEPTEAGARLTDVVEIEAEWRWLTPVYVAWGLFTYRRRHAPRLTMLAERCGGVIA